MDRVDEFLLRAPGIPISRLLFLLLKELLLLFLDLILIHIVNSMPKHFLILVN